MFKKVEFGGGLGGVADADTTEKYEVIVVVSPGEIVSSVTTIKFFRNGVDGNSKVFGRLDNGGKIDFKRVKQRTFVNRSSRLSGAEIGAGDFYRISRHYE